MGNVLKIIFLITLLIFSPLGEIARIDFGGNTAITMLDLGVGVLSIIWFLGYLVKKNKQQFILAKPLLIFISICLVSLLLQITKLKQQELIVSFLYLIRWVGYAGIYFAVASFDKVFKKKIVYCMVIAGSLIVLTGYLQYFLYPNLRNLEYLGWDVHLYRMFGSFFDPNFFGAFLVLYFMFLLSFVIARNEANSSTKRTEIAALITALLLLLTFLTLIAIYLTYSRSAYLMFVISLVTFFVLKQKVKWLLIVMSVVCILGALSFLFLNKHSEGTNLLRVNSAKARIGSSENALIIFERNPIMGVGFNAYRYAAKSYGFIHQKQGQIDHGGAGADNSWLFVLATTGIIGFLAYINLWVKIVPLFHCSVAKNPLYPLLLSSSVGLFVNAVFINSLFYPLIMFWIWILVGLIENTSL